MAIITVIGSGMMGSAITWPAADNGHTIRYVGSPLDRAIIDHARATREHLTLKRPFPKGDLHFYQIEELAEAMKGADLLLCGVSSFGLDWFLDTIIPQIPDNSIVLSITKGMVALEDGSMISYPEVMEQRAEALGKKGIDFNAVGGPCTSYELADLDPTEVTFCGRKPETLRWLKSLFEQDYYNISLSTDVRGVECAVALKNAYALGVSLAIGMSYKREGREVEHYNSQAALFGQAVREMTLLLDLCDGKPEQLPLGVGDLYVTVFGGRTRKIGTLLGTGMSFDEAMEILKGTTLESIVISTRTAVAVRRLIERGIVRAEQFPLLLHIDELVNGGKTVNVPWKAFEREDF